MKHHLNPSQLLDGIWRFAFLGDNPWEDLPGREWQCVPVPSAFDALPEHAGRRGLAVYETEVCAIPGRPLLLQFGAVSMSARVLVDGTEMFSHACGYSPFSVLVPSSTSTTRRLTVIVDNRFSFESHPMHEEYFDFYQYGGILRSVSARSLPAEGPHVQSVRVLPTESYREGEVEVTLQVGLVAGEWSARLAVNGLDCGLLRSQEGSVASLRVRSRDLRLWSPSNPVMQTLSVTLLDHSGRPIDDASVSFGLRRIESRNGHLWLNGERLVLKGYNRHEWHPNSGPCTSVLQMAADLQLLRGMGCNFVRGSHYPQDQRFLDLCDVMGMLVWEENLGWGQREKPFASETFRRHHAETLRNMVVASWNHPSIILWGFLNEAGTDQEYCGAVIEESVRILKELDPSRLTTYASMFGKIDRHFDKVDVISINQYPGWYCCEGHPSPLDLVAPGILDTVATIDARGYTHKPIIISEIGAEALYGWRDPHNDFYTEHYQAQYVRRACETVLGNDRLSGIALWHFSDARTYGGGRSMVRPRTFNNKGSFDEYRRPKAAVQAVSEVFQRC
ncbi:MAG: glycoside hydrolase family 2 TIM barrel-domain containing protein [Candidatus Methylacidiphilales bacterium]|nr:glycoside hydrolase family 2 TIM barrel-domain containing protein [Candidatus Methylacidiphilales bacterium]